MVKNNNSGGLIEALGIGLAIFSSAALIAEYLHDRKLEKEDEEYQTLCRNNGWTQLDQDKYGDCNLHNLKRRYAKEHNMTTDEVSKLMISGKVGFQLNIK